MGIETAVGARIRDRQAVTDPGNWTVNSRRSLSSRGPGGGGTQGSKRRVSLRRTLPGSGRPRGSLRALCIPMRCLFRIGVEARSRVAEVVELERRGEACLTPTRVRGRGRACPALALPRERPRDQVLRLLLDLPQMVLARKALRVELVDLLGSRRPRRKPSAFGHHL